MKNPKKDFCKCKYNPSYLLETKDGTICPKCLKFLSQEQAKSKVKLKQEIIQIQGG